MILPGPRPHQRSTDQNLRGFGALQIRRTHDDHSSDPQPQRRIHVLTIRYRISPRRQGCGDLQELRRSRCRAAMGQTSRSSRRSRGRADPHRAARRRSRRARHTDPIVAPLRESAHRHRGSRVDHAPYPAIVGLLPLRLDNVRSCSRAQSRSEILGAWFVIQSPRFGFGRSLHPSSARYGLRDVANRT